MSEITRALIIRQPHIGKILDGLKTWEMRSTPTKIRGRIGLIEGGSGLIVGEVDLVGVVTAPVGHAFRFATKHRHRLQENEFHLMDKWRFAWVLENAIRYERPVPYDHPKGAVIWVNVQPAIFN